MIRVTSGQLLSRVNRVQYGLPSVKEDYSIEQFCSMWLDNITFVGREALGVSG